MNQQIEKLEKLAEKHNKLVIILKKALLVGQMGFLKAGQILAEIKEKETYKAEDASHEWTWRDFLARPDLPFPGRTPESRRRTADALIRIYKLFQKKLGYDEKILASIGWTKLDLLAPVIAKTEKPKEIEEWLTKAQELRVSDLAIEIKGKGDPLTCEHEEVKMMWYCPKCGARFKEDPRPPDKRN